MLRPTNAELRNSHCWIQTHSYSLQILTPTSPPLPPSECTRQAATRPLHEETIHWYKLLTGSDFNTVVEGRNYWKKPWLYLTNMVQLHSTHCHDANGVICRPIPRNRATQQTSISTVMCDKEAVWQFLYPEGSRRRKYPSKRKPSFSWTWSALLKLTGKVRDLLPNLVHQLTVESNFGIYTDQVQIFTFKKKWKSEMMWSEKNLMTLKGCNITFSNHSKCNNSFFQFILSSFNSFCLQWIVSENVGRSGGWRHATKVLDQICPEDRK